MCAPGVHVSRGRSGVVCPRTRVHELSQSAEACVSDPAPSGLPLSTSGPEHRTGALLCPSEVPESSSEDFDVCLLWGCSSRVGRAAVERGGGSSYGC